MNNPPLPTSGPQSYVQLHMLETELKSIRALIQSQNHPNEGCKSISDKKVSDALEGHRKINEAYKKILDRLVLLEKRVDDILEAIDIADEELAK